MMERDPIVAMLKRHEGKVTKGDRHIVYKCTADKHTIGYGRNLDDRGLSQFEADILLQHDYHACVVDVKNIMGAEWFSLASTEMLAVLIDMRFALGAAGFRKFKKFIKAAKAYNLYAMELELKDSSWYRGDGKNRIDDLIRIMYGGFNHSK